MRKNVPVPTKLRCINIIFRCTFDGTDNVFTAAIYYALNEKKINKMLNKYKKK